MSDDRPPAGCPPAGKAPPRSAVPVEESRGGGCLAGAVIPFAGRFNRLFAGGDPVWAKLFGAATVGACCGASGWWAAGRGGGPRNTPGLLPMTLATAALGLAVGAALVAKDVVNRRRAAGERVPFPLRALFGWGCWSGCSWAVLVVGALYLFLGVAALLFGLD